MKLDKRKLKPFKNLLIFIPDEDMLMMKKFDLLIRLDPTIPKNRKDIIKVPSKVRSWKIRQLIKKYVQANEKFLGEIKL